MSLDIKHRISNRIQRIANVLLVNASFTDNIGLFNGKMGISIFFYHYARFTGKKVYEKLAGELIDETYEGVNQHVSLNFADGLTGISWGFEYLLKNRFVEADRDEVLSDIDSAVFKGTTQMPVYIKKNDLFGLGLYFLARLHGREQSNDNNRILFLKQMSVHMIDECERLLVHKRFLDVNISNLNAAQISSIMYFLFDVHRMGLFPIKVEKLLRYIPSYLEISTFQNDEWVDLKTLLLLTNTFQNIISDHSLKSLYQSATYQLADKISNNIYDKDIDKQLAKLSWHSIVYEYNYFKDKDVKILVEKAIDTIDNEKNWVGRLNSLDKNNIGLDRGLAGIGLAFLKYYEIL